MICKHCGKEIADQSVFCPVCGGKVERIGNGGLAANNLFVRFAKEKHNKGIMCELVLWGFICFSLLLSLVNIILQISDPKIGEWDIPSKLLWIFIFMVEVGFGVFVAFRWRGISILYGITIFLFIILIPFYMIERSMIGWYIGYSRTTFMTVCFALALMTAMGLVICGAFEFFTKMKMKLVVFICSIVEMSFIACMVVIPLFQLGVMDNIRRFSNIPYYRLILDSISYFLICCVVTLYTVFYCKGIIDSDKGNLFHLNGQGGGKLEKSKEKEVKTEKKEVKTEEKQALVGIQCIHGNYQGQAFPIQGEIIIGSQLGSAHIVLQDAYVSKQHCRIRFNAVSGSYELIDLSTNGVFLENGVRLQSNMYHSCSRGTVLYLGSKNQKYRLL